MFPMENQKLILKAKELKNLACIECTKKWINDHDGSTDPINDISECYSAGLITSKLKDRLINEVIKIKQTS